MVNSTGGDALSAGPIMTPPRPQQKQQKRPNRKMGTGQRSPERARKKPKSQGPALSEPAAAPVLMVYKPTTVKGKVQPVSPFIRGKGMSAWNAFQAHNVQENDRHPDRPKRAASERWRKMSTEDRLEFANKDMHARNIEFLRKKIGDNSREISLSADQLSPLTFPARSPASPRLSRLHLRGPRSLCK